MENQEEVKKSRLAISAFVISIISIIIPVIWFIPLLSSSRIFGGSFMGSFGLGWLLLGPLVFMLDAILSIAGLFMSIISLFKIRKGKLGGKWLAVIALIIFVIIISISVFYVISMTKEFAHVN